MTDRAIELNKLSLVEGCKYDYFVVGISSASFAYFAKDFTLGLIGINSNSFVLMALFLLASSIISGLKSIETNIIFLEKNGCLLDLQAKKAAYIFSYRERTTYINKEDGEILTPEESLANAKIIDRRLPEVEKTGQDLLDKIRRLQLIRGYGLFMGIFFLAYSKLHPSLVAAANITS